jgi:hypothetical protein
LEAEGSALSVFQNSESQPVLELKDEQVVSEGVFSGKHGGNFSTNEVFENCRGIARVKAKPMPSKNGGVGEYWL